MRKERKRDESAGDFSSVARVSSQSSDRVLRSENLAVAQNAEPVQQPLPESEAGPFSNVENVSSQIFDRIDAVKRPEAQSAASETKVRPTDSKMHRIKTYLLDIVPAENSEAELQDPETGAPPDYVLVRTDDPGAVPIVRSEGTLEQGDAQFQKPAMDPNIADVGYKAAQRRSQLPEGAEPMEGAPVRVDEDNMAASIRQVIVEQKSDLKKNTLPELEPVESGGVRPLLSKRVHKAWKRLKRFR